MTATINASTTAGVVITPDNSGALALQTNSGTTAVTIDTSQMVGIGTTTPKVRLAGKVLSINGTDSGANYQASIELLVNGASAGELWANSNDFVIGSYSTQPMIFRTQNTERMRINSSGNLLIKCTTNPSASVYGSGFIDNGVGASVLYQSTSITSANALQVFYNPNGNVGSVGTSGSNAYYSTTSDYRLKENITPMTGALAKVAQLKPVNYKWKADGSDGEGFIAHELAEVCPHAVVGNKDAVDADGNPVYQSIDTSFLVATLTAAIQELKAEVDALKAKVGE